MLLISTHPDRRKRPGTHLLWKACWVGALRFWCICSEGVESPQDYYHEGLPLGPIYPLSHLPGRDTSYRDDCGFRHTQSWKLKVYSCLAPEPYALAGNCSKHPTVGKCLCWLNATVLFCYANAYIPGVTHSSRDDTNWSRVESVHFGWKPQIPNRHKNLNHNRTSVSVEKFPECGGIGQIWGRYFIYIFPLFIEFHKISVMQQNKLEVKDFRFYFEGTGRGF